MIDQQYPITPPPELVERWRSQWVGADTTLASYIAKQAAQWGADAELEACLEWFSKQDWTWTKAQLLAARRPKPPSKLDLALKSLEGMALPEDAFDTISRAIQRLKDLEAQP